MSTGWAACFQAARSRVSERGEITRLLRTRHDVITRGVYHVSMRVHEQDCSVAVPDIEDAMRRARADFREMPGLRVTAHQARRLWMLDAETCATVLATLVASGFLSRSGSDAFVAR